ncbi:hypothetical protein EB118_12630 [bacterium]|nr:hypothetical protein [bacterium]NDG30905.1 hypothetical protein [bacterium]
MKLRLASIVILTLALACSKRPAHAPDKVEPKIKAKAELYKSLHKGWAHGKCDALGFNALCKLSGGCQDVDIYQAEGTPGRWYRSPEHDCYDLGQSASDISKDMLMMLFPYLYATGDKQNIREIYDYGKANGWVMGRGPLSRTYMTPPMVWLLQRMLGFDVSVKSETPVVKKAGFEKHLDAIALLTKAMIGGGLDPIQYEEIRKYSESSPRNALFSALYNKYRDGNQQQAIDILLDEKLFPSDSLPTARDRCEEYLWQRDDDPRDWGPCDSDEVHDGVDFLLAAYVAGQL